MIIGNKIRPKGELFPANAIAVQLGMLNSPQAFSKDAETKNKLGALLKNTERTLQKKKLPVRIYQRGGIQIVVTL